MKIKIRQSPGLFIIGLVILSIIVMIVGISIGPVSLSFVTVWKIIFSKLFGAKIEGLDNNVINIAWNLRFPRVLLGFVVGGGLAVSGVAIQSFTKNPLSEPYILGVSSGASTGAVLVALNGALVSQIGYYAMPVGAFLGAMASLTLVYLLSLNRQKRVNPFQLIFLGIASSAMFMAMTNFIVYSAKSDAGVRTAMFWMMGSLAGVKWAYVPIPAIILLVSFISFMILYRAMNTMLLGESTAIMLGVNLKRSRKVIVILASLLAGAIVSVSGSIGFVGLIIPHIVRSLVGSNHKYVLPASIFLGGIFIVLADTLARVIISPQELPIGIITALLGGPFFIYLLKGNKYRFGDQS